MKQETKEQEVEKQETKNVVAKVLKIVTNVFFVLCLVFALIVVFISFGGRKDNGVASVFGVSPLAVKTESMHPTIKKGDVIFINQKVTTFEEDDVITFKTVIGGQEALNTHRIIVKDPGSGNVMPSYTTKGDNETIADAEVINHTDIVGKYTGVRLPIIGFVINFASTFLGFFLLIMLPLLAYFIYHLIKVILAAVELKKEKEETEKISNN